MDKRGSRRQRAERDARAARTSRTSRATPQRGWRRWLKRAFLWSGALAALGLLFVGMAVLFAARSLPTFYQLKATQIAKATIVPERDTP